MSKLTGWFSQMKTFLVDVRAEWTKVTRPGSQEVWVTTGVVIVTSFIFAVFLLSSDKVIEFLYKKTFELLGLS